MAANNVPHTIVIGAGIGGLSAAISLAARGHAVTIVEQNATTGGKMGELSLDGFRWDTGPTVLTMRHVFESLFARAGKRFEDYVDLVPIEPLTRYFYPDGSILNLSRDWSILARELEAFDPRDVAGYLRFLAFAADLHRITGPVFIYNRPPRIQDFLRVLPRDMLKVAPFATLHQAISRHVHDPRLRQLLGRFATYVGASPYTAPAALGVIAHVELSGGVWYPRGGIYQIAAAMTQLAQELSVTIHHHTPVQQIQVKDGRACGVTLASGEKLGADNILANVDVTTVYTKLLPPGTLSPRQLSRQQQRATSCSAFVLLLGVRGSFPQFAHHNVFFCRDYRREFADIFERGQPPADPTVYVSISCKTDPAHAPSGHENWFVLVNAPSLNEQFDWRTQAKPYRDHVLATLARHGFDIRDAIVAEKIITPETIAAHTGAWRGALYGISSNSALNAFRRPHNRCPSIRNLYFAGGTTHPGGGVPLVTLSGMLAAQLIERESP